MTSKVDFQTLEDNPIVKTSDLNQWNVATADEEPVWVECETCGFIIEPNLTDLNLMNLVLLVIQEGQHDCSKGH